MLEPLKKIKKKLIESASHLSDAQLERRLKIYKSLSLYYGAKIVIGGALVVAGVVTLALGAVGIALPLPVWAGAGGLGIGALMTANAVIGNRAFERAYKAYAREKSARLPEAAAQTARTALPQGLKTRFIQARRKTAALLPRKAANDKAPPLKNKNAP